MKYKLADIFDLQMGKTPDRHTAKYWGNGTEPWISISDISNCGKYIVDTKEKISKNAIDECGIKMIPADTVIMSFKLSIGKVAITQNSIYSNEAIMAFISKGITKVRVDYLYYLLLHRNWEEEANKAVMGKTLNKATLSEVVIDVCSYDRQECIVSILDRVNGIIQCQQKQLEYLDMLIKARFVELFGDPMINDKGFRTVYYGDRFNMNAGGTPSKTHLEYWDNGTISWIGSNMCQNTYVYENSDGNYITEEGYRHSSAKVFPIDTVLIALVGATIGKTALLKFETSTNQNVLGIRGIKEGGYTPEFVFFYTQGLYKKFLNIGGGGFAMASKSFISKLPIPIVNYQSQEQFSAFAEEIDKSKAAIQKSLDETQVLFDSLMQQYFG